MRTTLTLIIALLVFSPIWAQRADRRQANVDYNAAVAEAKANAEKYLRAYNLDEASEQVDRWEDLLDRQHKEYPPELSRMRERIIMARNMLERVEKIEIVDTLHVDSIAFFTHYMLSPDAGRLQDSSILPDEYSSTLPTVVFSPESEKELMWGMPIDGRRVLAVADVLDDGTIDTPRVFGNALSDANTDFPFLMQDGVTIYFGATGEASLGGYDIFMTRRGDDDQMLQPQNIGMPYNSPYNDFMLAIDDANQLGWWASDRELIPGKVTIYVFVPSKMRVNYEPGHAQIADFALLNNVKPTDNLEEHLKYLDDEDPEEEPFFFPLPDGRVYTRVSDFKNPQARQAMKNLLKRMFDIEVDEAQLATLRQRYADGDHSVAPDILKLERQQREAPAAIKRITNQIISLEK